MLKFYNSTAPNNRSQNRQEKRKIKCKGCFAKNPNHTKDKRITLYEQIIAFFVLGAILCLTTTLMIYLAIIIFLN